MTSDSPEQNSLNSVDALLSALLSVLTSYKKIILAVIACLASLSIYTSNWNTFFAFSPIVFIWIFFIIRNYLYKKNDVLKIQGDASDPDYFRFAPRDEKDHDKFVRYDNAHIKIIRWVKNVKNTWIYLSGDSGVGKTSLLKAYIIPELMSQRYTVFYINEPAFISKGLTQEVQNHNKSFYDSKTDWCILDFVKNIANKSEKNLFIILDQFEKIVNKTVPLNYDDMDSNLILELSKTKSDKIIILAIIRSECLGDLLKSDKYKHISPKQENFFMVQPFNESDARAFFKDSGLNVNDDLLAELFAEAAVYENKRGQIRPILLNFMGIILSRYRGGSLPKKYKGKIFFHYLENAISDAGNHAKVILSELCKENRHVYTLVDATKYDKNTINECLNRLSYKGLVREINKDAWEISHEFIKIPLERIIKSDKKSIEYKFILNLVVLFLFLAVWPFIVFKYDLQLYAASFYYNQIKKELSKCTGVVIEKNGSNTYDVTINGDSDKDNKPDEYIEGEIHRASDLLHRLCPKIENLRLTNMNKIDFISIKELSSLKKLTIDNIVSLSEYSFDVPDGLNYLTINNNKKIVKINFQNNHNNLQTIIITGNSSLERIENLESLQNLEKIEINDNDGLIELPPIDLIKLKNITIFGNDKLTTLPTLDHLTGISTLNISDNSNISNLSSLEKLENLIDLEILSNANLKEIGSFANLKNLEKITIKNNNILNIIPSFGELPHLTDLEISGNNAILNIQNLDKSSTPNIQRLKIINNGLNRLPLLNIPSLTELTLGKNECGLLKAKSETKNIPKSLKIIFLFGNIKNNLKSCEARFRKALPTAKITRSP